MYSKCVLQKLILIGQIVILVGKWPMADCYFVLLTSPQEYADRIRPMVTDTVYLINDVISEGKNVLIEGANAVMLDFDLGEYGCCGTFN